MNSTINNIPKEIWQPLPHVAPKGFNNSIFFYLRLFFDITVSTTYNDVKKFLLTTNNRVLEVGCGLRPYSHLIPEKAKYSSIDWDGARDYFHYKDSNTIYYHGDVFPLKDSSFEFLFHTEVLEHIYGLDLFLKECHRVLTNGGKMFFTIPFAARYHYIPYDYWRLTAASLEKLLTKAGFKNILIKTRGSDVIVIITKTNAFFARIVMRKIDNLFLGMVNKVIFGIFFAIPWISFTLLGHALLFLKIGSVDDPLGYSVYCEKETT